MSLDLTNCCSKRHSQWGEDGILEAIFNAKGVTNGYFCEFGAWDGKHLSNTYAFYEKGWSGCYIEGERERVADLRRNITRTEVSIVNAFVTPSGQDTLDAILARVSAPHLDLLSIDIDSDDLAIWQSVSRRASVVVIEYNPTIPPDVAFVNPRGKQWGNSARAIYDYARQIGYDFVAITETNLILAAHEFNNTAFRVLGFDDLARFPGFRFFFAYDGTLIISDHQGRVSAPEVMSTPFGSPIFVQPIQKSFRRFSENSLKMKIGRILARISTAARRPVAAIRHFSKRG